MVAQDQGLSVFGGERSRHTIVVRPSPFAGSARQRREKRENKACLRVLDLKRDIATASLVNLPLPAVLRARGQVGVESVDKLFGLIRRESMGGEMLAVKLMARKSSLRWGCKSTGIGTRVEMLTAQGKDGG